jgi:hypothetical protein
MKNILLCLFLLISLASCKSVIYTGDYGQLNQTQVVLSNANFTVLGHFKGVVTEKKVKRSIKDMPGLTARAKEKLFENAKSAGVQMEGSRTLVNVTTDMVQTSSWVTVTVSGEIIEFDK